MAARADDKARRAFLHDQQFEPLAALWRGEAVESIHRGVLVVVDEEGRYRGGVGDPRTPIHLRSLAKPFQALAVIESGAADAFGVTSEELALMAGSHAGQKEHVQRVRTLLARIGIKEDALVCGPVSHMCSGKHAGMLLLATHRGVSLDGYEQPLHPVQVEIAATVARLLDLPAEIRSSMPFVGVDGCGLPVLHLAAFHVAKLFALLGAGAGPGLARVRDAMLAHPELVGGRSWLDTRLMQGGAGHVVAKSGVDGLQGLALRAGGSGSGAFGVVIKVEDGSPRPLPALIGFCAKATGISLPADVLKPNPTREEVAASRSLSPSQLEVLVDADVLGVSALEDETSEIREAAEAVTQAAVKNGQVELLTQRGDERDLVRFLRQEWPLSDEEVFGRRTQWLAEPFALAVKEKRVVLAVLKGHFLGGVASIDELIVGRGYRGRGLGTLMLKRFETEARERECIRVTLRAVNKARAEYFYRRHGYHTECVQLEHEFGEDFIRLTRRLDSPPEGV